MKKHSPISVVHVYHSLEPKKIRVGRLATKDHQIFFEYDGDFLKSGLAISPFKLPLKSGVQRSEDRIFEGLFGVFNDSLPDGWGRLLLDRKLLGLGIEPGVLSPLDRLSYVGNKGMGSFSYEPEVENEKVYDFEDLDRVAGETYEFIENEDDQFVDELLAMNGSSAGARPKVLVTLNGRVFSESESCLGENDWIIKFRSSLDPKDIGPIEYAYHLMAQKAGLEVPEARLFSSKKGPGYFGVKRFDHFKGHSLHMHTASGLLHADHRIPSLDYETLLKATLFLTKDVREGQKQFRACVFNVLSHNRDDHTKNFSFLMDEKGRWRVSPAYDLTFSSGPSGEHCTTVMGEGAHPTLDHLLRLSEITSLKKQEALNIIEEVKYSISQWNRYASEAGVSQKSSDRISKVLDREYP